MGTNGTKWAESPAVWTCDAYLEHSQKLQPSIKPYFNVKPLLDQKFTKNTLIYKLNHLQLQFTHSSRPEMVTQQSKYKNVLTLSYSRLHPRSKTSLQKSGQVAVGGASAAAVEEAGLRCVLRLHFC